MTKAPEEYGQKLYQSIIAVLQQEIAAGLYAKGSRLPAERVLVQRFGVSRLTVREAIVGMEMLGLVEAKRGSGVHVKESHGPTTTNALLDIGDFDLTETRRLVEGECAALAAKCALPDDLVKLSEAFDKLASGTGDYIEDLMLDMEFHVQIARCTHNPAMVLVVEMLWQTRLNSPLSMEMIRRTVPMSPDNVVDEHRPIMTAIANADSASARSAMRAHLTQTIARLLSATETEEVESARKRVADRRARAALLD